MLLQALITWLRLNDIAKTSLKQALIIEEAYDNHRMADWCIVLTILKLLKTKIKDMIELFEGHDQIFILKGDVVYKFHLTKESVHKLFLN